MKPPKKSEHLLYLWTVPKKPNIISRAIMWRLKTQYSHVCVAVYIKDLDEYRIYQASHGDVNSVLLCNFLENNDVKYTCRIPYTHHLWLLKLKYLENQTGKKYSVWGAVAATFKLLRKWGWGDDGDKSFICSEYGYRVYVHGYEEFHSPGAINSDYVDPKWFRERLIADGFPVLRGPGPR